MAFDGIRRAFLVRLTARHVEREIDDELAFHMEQRTLELIASGMTPDEAHAEAARRFGDRALRREQCLAEDMPMWQRERVMDVVDSIITDARRAARSLRRSLWFTLVTIATLAIGISAVTAIFSFVYSFYWRPLPFPDADRIVSVIEQRANRACCFQGVTPRVADLIASSNRSFDRTTRYDVGAADLVVGDEARSAAVLLVDTAFSRTLMLRTQLGRLPSADEILANAPVAAISDKLWRALFGADESAIGKRVHVGNDDVRIVGVLPPHFGFPRVTDVLRPVPPATAADSVSTFGFLAHLKPGVTRRAAEAELTTIAQRTRQEPALSKARISLALMPEMLDRRANQALPMPSLFLAAALFLLLIACSNVANLVLVRAADRRSEMAVRGALGASRGRLIRLSLSESLVVSAVAGTIGVFGAVALLKLGVALLPTDGLPAWLQFGLDARLLAFTIAVVFVVTLSVGLTPALEGTRFDLARALKTGGDGGALASNVARSGRRGLAIQLALSIVLFIGAGLFLQSYRGVSRVDVGYPSDHVVDVTMFFNPNRYDELPGRIRVSEELRAQLRGTRGFGMTAIRGFSANRLIDPASSTPETKRTFSLERDDRIIPDGDTTRAIGEFKLPARMRQFVVSEDYFATARLKLLRGRGIEPTDAAGGLLVAVVSDRFARTFWRSANSIGRQFQYGKGGPQYTVVGVVQDVRDLQGGRAGYAADAHPDVYYSYRQVETYYPDVVAFTTMSATAASAMAAAAVHRIDPQLVSRTQPLGGAGEARVVMTVFGSVMGTFAIGGLLLSVIGLYGVVGYSVAQRRREIGVRLALGATPDSISRLLVRQSMRFVGAGIIIGMLMSAGAGRVMQVFLFRVSPVDVPTYAAAAVLFAAVAIAGCWAPSRRAATVDPMFALRAE